MKDEALVLAARALTVAINGSMTARWKQGEEALAAVHAALNYEQQSTTDSEMFKIRSAYKKGFEHGLEQSKPWISLTNDDIIRLTSQYSGMQLVAAIDAELKEKNA